MKKPAFIITHLVSVALMALLLTSSRAAAQDYDDPPSRVARLSYMQGYVSFSPSGTYDWVDAFVNRPLTTGDALWTDRGARAALHIGSASIHVSESTGISFLNLTDDTVQIQINAGTLRLRVKRLGQYENFEIDTPNLAFTILRPGIYKINVSEDGYTTIVEDRSGEGEVTGGGFDYTLRSGDIGRFVGSDHLDADMDTFDDYYEDDFDRWSEQRDHHEDISISARYVSDDAIGYDDLDDNGGWRPVPAYGMVWFPHTSQIGWAPYHYGHWAYVAPWGYTWVDDAAWGFAPFHYGRWVTVDGVWGWIPCPPRPPTPGPQYVRPVYAPALVAWIGGPHFGIGVGVGVGWFPLGPREVFMPSYPVSRNYVSNVNVSNTTVNTTVVNNYYTTVVVNKTVNITNVTYVNQRVPGAVAAVSQQAFSSGQPVAHNAVHVDDREVASAPVNALTPSAVPQRQAVMGGRPTANVRPPAAIQTRAIVAKTAPPPPPPSFTQRQAAIQSNGGRPLSVAQVKQIVPVRAPTASAPQIKVAPPAVKAVAPKANPSHPIVPPSAPGAVVNSGNRKAPPQVASQPPVPQHTAAPPPPAAAVNKPPQSPPPPAAAVNKPPQSPPPPAAAVNKPPQSPPPPAVAVNKPPQPPPPTAHPLNEQLEQQHQQQVMDLHKQQDLERQQLEQQQKKESALLQQQKADAIKQQQIQQQHQQQLQQLAQKHAAEQQSLQAKQEQEHRQQEQQQKKPPPKEKPEQH